MNCIALPGAAQTILTQNDIDALDMTMIDTSLSKVALQLDQLRSASGKERVETSFSGSAESGTGKIVPNTMRSPSNALCFGDAVLGMTTPEMLEDYLEGLAGLVRSVDATLVAFEGLKDINPQGACPAYMTSMITTVDGQIAEYSRSDISELVFHLETCWPDSTVERQDSQPLDMDGLYAHARNRLSDYGRIQRGYREAAGWCE